MPAAPAEAAPAEVPPAAPAAAGSTPSRGPRARRGIPLPVLVGGGAGVILLAVVGGWLWLSGSKPAAPVAPAVVVPVRPVAIAPVVTAPVRAVPLHKPQGTPAAAECRAAWKFDVDSGSTAADTTGNGWELRLEGHATFGRDPQRGGVLSLTNRFRNDANYAQTIGPVVDTTQSFTVVAWVNFTTVANYETVVSIDGKEVSGFYLQFNHAEGDRFLFNRLSADDGLGGVTAAKSTFTPVAHTWYHLAGVYDADARTLSLYVNGQWQSTVPFTTPWLATGGTAVGRGYFGGEKKDFVNGLIGEVRLYAGVLPVDKILALAAE